MIRILSLFTILFIAVSGFTPAVLPDEVIEIIRKDLPANLALYTQLHQYPEVSLEEVRTAALLAESLRLEGFVVTERVGGTGIVGMLENGPGPRILYRTDLDALPITEQTELSYASKVVIDYGSGKSGVMHACGHDVHMSVWIGVARTMAKFRDQWHGTLMMIGQPAEEIGLGAKMMLKDGLYEKFGVPDYGIALHSSAALPAGQVGLNEGYTMANAESINIKVFGLGAHGAQPHLSIDPIVVASMMVIELQTIVSRNLKPTDAAVVTVGSIQGGVKNNIIPDGVVLKLTVRTFTAEVREMVHRRIREIANGVALAAGLPKEKMPEISVLDFSAPANYNNPDLVGHMRASATLVVGADQVVSVEPQTVAEDFALYGLTEHRVPTALYWLGTVPDARIQSKDMPGLHTPRYYPDPEKSLFIGISVTTQMLLDLFATE
jgi:hippurate hydrolase